METRHRPPHIDQPDHWVHITAATVDKQRLFTGDERKALYRDILQEKCVRFDVILRAWVMLDNHYHLLCRFPQAGVMVLFIKELHGASVYGLNQLDEVSGRKVWQNYWDRSVRDERELWTVFNYIHQNPVKHGYVVEMADWAFSSYGFWLEKQGSEWMADCMAQYPVVDFVAGGE